MMVDVALLKELRDKILDIEDHADEIGATSIAYRLGLLADEVGEEISEAEDDGWED